MIEKVCENNEVKTAPEGICRQQNEGEGKFLLDVNMKIAFTEIAIVLNLSKDIDISCPIKRWWEVIANQKKKTMK